MEEAIHCTVPVLVIPFLGDQYANANRLEKLKVGLQIDLLDMNEENLKEKIIEATKPEYKRNMQKLHDLVYDQPISSLEKAMFWIEYVIRHKGAKHLEFRGKIVPFHQAYCLDYIAIFLLFSLCMVYITKKILAKASRSFSSRNKSKNEWETVVLFHSGISRLVDVEYSKEVRKKFMKKENVKNFSF